jgi:hypothetical protein
MAETKLISDDCLLLELDAGDRELISHVDNTYFKRKGASKVGSTYIELAGGNIYITKHNGEMECATLGGKRTRRLDAWAVEYTIGWGWTDPETGCSETDTDTHITSSLLDALKESTSILQGWELDRAFLKISNNHFFVEL